VARDDHKVRIEVGYGLEGDLPDASCGRIIRDEIVPRFRGGDYAGGVNAGVDAIVTALSGSPSSPSQWSFGLRPGHRPVDFTVVFAALVCVWLLIQDFFQLTFRPAPPGALLNFLLLDLFVSLFVGNWWGFGIGAALFVANTILLAVLEWIAPNTGWGRELSKKAARKGTPMYWLSSSGSGSSGGSYGGGSSGGGGFSGGGGSFGGGGASGSW
jgi:uncharacterized protein